MSNADGDIEHVFEHLHALHLFPPKKDQGSLGEMAPLRRVLAVQAYRSEFKSLELV